MFLKAEARGVRGEKEMLEEGGAGHAGAASSWSQGSGGVIGFIIGYANGCQGE